MASSFPFKKNTAVRVVFPIFDDDGDLVSGAAGLDSEYSLDGGDFVNLADEAHEIQSSGMYYLDLAAGETNGDVVCIQIKTSTTDAKTTILVFYTAAQTLNTVYTDAAKDTTVAKDSDTAKEATAVAGFAAGAKDTDSAKEATVNAVGAAVVALASTVAQEDTVNSLAGIVALETTLAAMKGVGWTDETLKQIYDDLPAAADVWDVILGDHVDAGSAGKKLDAIPLRVTTT